MITQQERDMACLARQALADKRTISKPPSSV